ncbi:glycosyltransferase [Salinimonas sediminis]|uniref:Glycosyltransferase n=1 Tax=Salinimonas sediminis TaxID=2303538 RepID=A0A346NP75_9ALTE|nr:glycosyltransferase [Salinimonas sediminis]AXR07332.1 glycosyltransferase [Salinimonas sediminis]
MSEIAHPLVSIIIPAFNEELYIADTLQALHTQSYGKENVEVIVVDNGSADDTVIVAQEHADKVLSYTEKPVGKVRNYGVDNCNGEIVFFLDADCVAPSNWIEVGVKSILDNPDTVFGGGIKLREHASFVERFWLLEGRDGETLPKELLGASIVLRKSIFLKVGGFSTTLTAGEDSKLHQDLVAQGVNVKMVRFMSVVHLGNARTIKSFIKRQIWHSEGYSSRLRKACREPIFIFTVAFMLSIISLPITAYLGIGYISILILLVVVFIRTIDRIRKTKNNKNYKSFLKVAFVDFLYFSGRSIGFLKGFFTKKAA